MGWSNVQNFSTHSYFWENRQSSKTFKGTWPLNSLVWWPKIYISIEGFSRPFQRCMTLYISMLYIVRRASERSFSSLRLFVNFNFLDILMLFLEAGGCTKHFLGARCSSGHPMEGFQSFFPIFATHQILACTPNLKRPSRNFWS